MIWMVIAVVGLGFLFYLLCIFRKLNNIEKTMDSIKEEQDENMKEQHFSNWLVNDRIKDINSQLIKHKEWIKDASDTISECSERLTKLESPTIRKLQKKRKLKK